MDVSEAASWADTNFSDWTSRRSERERGRQGQKDLSRPSLFRWLGSSVIWVMLGSMDHGTFSRPGMSVSRSMHRQKVIPVSS